MKFFWTGNMKNSRPIHTAILLFTAFVFLFWISAFVNFGLKFGYSVEKIETYFFGEPDFPDEISIAHISEETHINLFIFSLLFLCIAALLIYSTVDEKLKMGLILSFASLGLLYSLSDYIVVSLGNGYGILKMLLFLLFQAVILLSLLIIWFKNSRNRQDNGNSKFLVLLIFLFAVFNIFFVGLNFILFAEKIGFTISSVVDYYLGNAEKFIKPKSIKGLFEVAYLHLIPMALYLITLIHFVYIVNDKFNTTLTVLLFAFAIVDNFSGILIVLLGREIAGVKLFSFFMLQFLLIFSSVILIYKLMFSKSNFPNRGRI
ncbi:MAG: hypothetical protein RMJ81_09635 [Candidatus Kryptonium sp.]|nr:hypothetical protein [Candidatus Kryptonium sp.]